MVLKSPVPKDLVVGEMKPIARASLSDKIVEQIIDLISRDVLKPGERLPPERELCKKFGVGRTSLREALRSLAVMGILDGRVGEGTFISNNNKKYLEKTLQWGLLLDRKKVQDLIETRLMLESQTAFLAAGRATKDDLVEIDETLQGMEETLGQPEQYLEFDLRFHLLIARATQNTILYSMLSTTRSYLQEWIKSSLARPAGQGGSARAIRSLQEHEQIVAALHNGAEEEAREAMAGHILSSSVDMQTQVIDREGAE